MTLNNYSLKLDYIRKLYVEENETLSKIDQIIRDKDIPIHINPEEGKLLQLLIKLIDAKKIVEVGTLAGYSTIWMAESLGADGQIYTIEHDKLRQIRAEKNFSESPYRDKITLLKGNAKIILHDLNSKGPFDLIFIDADKPGYVEYLDWAEVNIRKGGLIIGDDTFLSEAVYLENLPERIRASTKDTMNEFNKRLADPSKYHGIMLPTEKGLTIAMRK